MSALKNKLKFGRKHDNEDKKSESDSDSDNDGNLKISVRKKDANPSAESDGDENIIESINPAYRYEAEVIERKKWDAFNQNEEGRGSASEMHTDLIKKASYCLKITTSLITFIIVFVAACISKGALFFMIANVSPPSFINGTNSNLSLVPNPPLQYCPALVPDSDGNATYYVHFDENQSISWMWCIFFAYIIPEILTFLRSLKHMVFKTVHLPKLFDFFLVLLMESIHVTGMAILFYCALPHMDSVRAVMATSAVTLIPSIFKLLADLKDSKDSKKMVIKMVLDLISIILVVVGILIWPVVNPSLTENGKPNDMINNWAFPTGVILASFGWWESFVTERSKIPPIRYLWRLKTNMNEGKTRFVTYFFVSAWKVFYFLILFIVFAVNFNNVRDSSVIFDKFKVSMLGNGYKVYSPDTNQYVYGSGSGYESVPIEPNGITNTWSNSKLPWKILATQVCCGFVAYHVGKFACSINIQKFSFALPLTLVMPTTIAGILGLCEVRSGDPRWGGNPCRFDNNHFPNHLFYQCPMDYNDNYGYDTIPGYLFINLFGWVWILLFLAHFWITFHIWMPKSPKLASTEQLFGTPGYNGLLVDQSLRLNRRSDKGQLDYRLDFESKKSSGPTQRPDSSFHRFRQKIATTTVKYVEGSGDLKPEDTVTRVFGCATMWHENEEECTEMLKSIFRIDEDYSARKLAKKILDVEDPDYYEWATHIFFDDCMEPDDSGYEMQVNQFVRLLINTMDTQGKKWYGSRNMKVPDPTKVITPYGGRLIWTLPGGTQVVCHLKDKNKIRHKKRWSQIMYFYYFLGWELEANPNLSRAQKDARAENTYCLALDGDVDFQAEAIIRVVDLMKRNPGIGAACGRIHPTGSGFMQWYQMFEYAIGHWLQKSTEHVLGCVLCSPGCFSLFRGKAIMSDNVMKTYTTVPTEAQHFVQYDQGEDRWLCTLLLQQGWRVEYCAASDSFTAAPEGFNEFYNQRRRWMPSTMLNILDLLGDAANVVRKNDDISALYVLYQGMLIVGTIIGPGTIFLMLVGACSMSFMISTGWSLAINLPPLIIFCFLCLKGKTATQLMMAQLLSVAYAFLMVAVMIGLVIQIVKEGPFGPTAIMALLSFGGPIIAGFLHPQEFKCMLMMPIYLMMIPSMYLFLFIYSIFNLNVVSWGTREVAQKKSAEEKEAEAAMAEEKAQAAETKARQQSGTIWGRLTGGGMSKLSLFSRTEQGLREDLGKMQSKLESRLDDLEKAMKKEGYSVPAAPKHEEKKSAPKVKMSATQKKETKPRIQRDEMVNPFWIEQEDQVKTGPVQKISDEEINFWYKLIELYLKPLDKDVKKQEEDSKKLIEFRNKWAFTTIMINGFLIVGMLFCEFNKDTLAINWPINDMDGKPLELSPIGLFFILFFIVVLVLQMIGMLAHRLLTLGHIVATTRIPWKKAFGLGKKKQFNADKMLAKRGIDIMKEWQTSYQPEGSERHSTMESVVDDIIVQLNSGTEEQKRKYSKGLTLGDNNKSQKFGKQLQQTIRQRHQTYKERKKPNAIRNPLGGRRPPTIAEDNEGSIKL